MPADVFQAELTRCRELQQLALCYVQSLITQMSQSIVCVAHHSVIERLCYWLLFNQDAVCSDQLNVTHETIANMLGVRRESITQALGKLQSAGLVSSGRGKIHIRDRDGLAESVCECFSLVCTETRRLYERLERLPDFAEDAHLQDMQAGEQDHALLHKYQDALRLRTGRFCQSGSAGSGGSNQSGRRDHAGHPAFTAHPQPSGGLHRSGRSGFVSELPPGSSERQVPSLLRSDPMCHRTPRRDGGAIDATLDEMGDECRLVMIDVTEEKKIAAQELALERQQQERLARQPFMLWFKDPQGRLVSANASLLQDWQHFAQDAALEKIDVQSMPMTFFHPSCLV
ncbi:hypothetical protein GHT06_007464 [Daphnia sinensis]|uniref:HTH crp-type domain-containing protein n=1 Tax=Daphnia sinensis TaxID=1820382 RepID=A0AAD5KU54_9CRUS|nr:hypothetical protein GHT06_007464 [Daphnia sinensis]